MKTKNIKVVYTSRYSRGSYAPIPKVQMEGKWLEQLGFTIGAPLIVEYAEGSIHIRTLTAEELAAKEKQEAQKELAKRIAELEKIVQGAEAEAAALSMVAEPSPSYATSEPESRKQ